MNAEILRVLRVIVLLLAAILVVLTYSLVGMKAGVTVFGILAIALPIALFSIAKSTP